MYQTAADRTGTIGTQLNQARALKLMGFYRRARTQLEQIEATLSAQADSDLKAAGLLNLGNVLRTAGDLEASQNVLRQSLAIARRLRSQFPVQMVPTWIFTPPTAYTVHRSVSCANRGLEWIEWRSRSGCLRSGEVGHRLSL
ncbi:MAG: tetratricopeptide repeat protein, partial [Leptolyngbyaceae cyanobacterium SU_3_3]|nr:tetratricopeptide repeat protein [Leptolyngbyaceae cyanobacterium SU_3_3]